MHSWNFVQITMRYGLIKLLALGLLDHTCALTHNSVVVFMVALFCGLCTLDTRVMQLVGTTLKLN
ncbi:hypothetical protein BDV25DRAFT_158729, partial [Aspergillus avenaceus]